MLARLEFSLTPEGEKQLTRSAPSQDAAAWLADYSEYGDTAVAVAADSPLLDRIRALALSMRINLRAAREPGYPNRTQAGAYASKQLGKAKELLQQNSTDWASSLELAQQLYELVKGNSAGQDSKRYLNEALSLLKSVRQQGAPPDVISKRVDPLESALNKLGTKPGSTSLTVAAGMVPCQTPDEHALFAVGAACHRINAEPARVSAI